MSNGDASKTPSVIDGIRVRLRADPDRFPEPRDVVETGCSAAWMVAMLRDIASARRNVISPSYSSS